MYSFSVLPSEASPLQVGSFSLVISAQTFIDGSKRLVGSGVIWLKPDHFLELLDGSPILTCIVEGTSQQRIHQGG